MARIGIVAAWEPEIECLRRRFPARVSDKIACWEFHSHLRGEMEIISVISGVGKVNCASCTQLLINQFNPDELFMTGICGGLAEEVNGKDMIIAKNTLQHDVTDAGSGIDPKDLYRGRNSVIQSNHELVQSFSDFATKRGVPVHLGTVVSGDQRIRNCQTKITLRVKYKAVAVDQEIAAFSQVCYVNDKRFLAVKCVSDHADENTLEDQKRLKLQACRISCNLLLDYLEDRL